MDFFPSPHPEEHTSHRSGWLRAAVLGINDGIVSTSSLMLGVLAAAHGSATILTAGAAGLVAGALSMAVGEYVSVSSQKDSEMSDIAIERRSLSENPDQELEELAWIYQKRGLSPELAREVAQKLHEKDALIAHARDELGIDNDDLADPLEAAIASAVAFSLGGAIPIIAALVAGVTTGGWTIVVASLVALAVSGAVGAVVGGGSLPKASLRVFIGGGIAMAITFGIGHIIGLTL